MLVKEFNSLLLHNLETMGLIYDRLHPDPELISAFKNLVDELRQNELLAECEEEVPFEITAHLGYLARGNEVCLERSNKSTLKTEVISKSVVTCQNELSPKGGLPKDQINIPKRIIPKLRPLNKTLIKPTIIETNEVTTPTDSKKSESDSKSPNSRQIAQDVVMQNPPVVTLIIPKITVNSIPSSSIVSHKGITRQKSSIPVRMTHPNGTVEDFDSMGLAAKRLKILANIASTPNDIQRRISSCLKKPGEKGYFSHYYNYKFEAI